jgi:eukaryotic-like serine/threonine-protein kinase
MVADRYRLERKVGGGRVSAVWRVHDQVTDATCAVKLLHRSMHKHTEALTRFSLEDRLARELTGPHFPERVGSGSWEGMRYIAWRWHEGESLRALFDRNPKQDAPTVHSIVQETCQALTGVHAAGYTHGDLKPENLYFADRGESDPSRQLKLIGFGVASRIAALNAASSSRKRPGQLVGTPLYMSPDLILGRMPKGGQADLWALAVLVYEALTGRAPFLGEDLGAVLEAILKRDAPRPSSVADNLPGTFDLWWAQALEQEFSTPNEFATSLSRALGPALRSSHTQRSALFPERLSSAAFPERLSATESSALGALGASSPAGATASASANFVNDSGAAGSVMASGSSPPPPAAVSSVAGGASASVAASSNPAAAPPNPSPTSITSSGIGPARLAVSVARTLEAPASAEAPAPSPTSTQAVDGPFAPLPSPLRDLGAAATRKTLVGITPHLSLSAPAPSAAPSITPASLAIEGAPCRSIEISAVVPVNDAAPGSEPRRPNNPTVPFPRPRLLPRLPPLERDTTPVGAGATQNTWRGPTTRTLRFVLTSRDHKPQRIAALLVCVVAAIVIFVVGRSPVAGTAAIDQSTRALSAASAKSTNTAAAPTEEGAVASAKDVATAQGPTSDTADPAIAGEPPVTEPAITGKELAPGLVVPADEAAQGTDSARGTTAPASQLGTERAAPRPAPKVTEPARTPVNGSGARGPAPSNPNVRPRPELNSPVKRPAAAPPPTSKGGDFDFGI